ncbi:MAG: DUF362 domain-containing protein [Syntrophobacterales bacterium]|nr:DUF362 domain-containing protein [Syntrophobacterales bacterium]
MGSLHGLGLEFQETMSGWLGVGQEDFLAGRIIGEREHTPLRFEATITIDDLEKFIQLAEHEARLTGTVTFAPLGGTFPMEDGVFNLFSVSAEGIRRMTYAFRFTAADGRRYFLFGYKNLKDDPGFDLVEDMTTLFTRIHAGPDERAPLYGSGQLFFDLKDAPALLSSLKVTGAGWWELHKKIQARLAFLDFAWGKIRQEYLRDLNPLYDTEYENLVLAGKVDLQGEPREFFLVSGIHDRDFPWGDGEIFWDVLLVIEDGRGGWRRFAVTDRFLPGLKLNVQAGTYRYQGPLYELTRGYAASRSEMQRGEPSLIPWQADLDLTFTATPFPVTPLPFAISHSVLAQMASSLKWVLRSILPGEALLGVFITPHTVAVREGRLALRRTGEELRGGLLPEGSFGEAERTTFRNLKEPTLLYGYICAVRPQARAAQVQIHANSLRNERQRLTKDQFDAFLGAVVDRVASREFLLEGGTLKVSNLGPREEGEEKRRLFRKLGEPVLEVNNDHFPTAVFQRRIIRVADPAGWLCLALEEDMNLMRLEAENSRRQVTVAAIRDPDKFKALETALKESGFWDVLAAACQASGKAPADFALVIKPNFMFAYNKSDRSTFTDPELVHHLVRQLKGRGWVNLTVAEAQSTYGEYFDKRSVREVAQYLGYVTDGSAGYRLVDLTLDEWEERYLGPHLGLHPVPRTWRDADFRISFAKNKTHAYAYYSLTLKNIYGALPLADKFSAYHTGRDIYHTTMEYLRAFPVHFGIIDAHLSADGPFGVFADPEPNRTETVIAGPDLVAVDWVGASKMGLNPKISRYMELAVQAFGKPEIRLVGDPNLYRPWLNVPAVMTILTHFGLDANDYFGNLLYMAGAYMDESHFTHKSRSAFMQAARRALRPLQHALFLQAGGERTLANRLLSRFFTWLGSR